MIKRVNLITVDSGMSYPTPIIGSTMIVYDVQNNKLVAVTRNSTSDIIGTISATTVVSATTIMSGSSTATTISFTNNTFSI